MLAKNEKNLYPYTTSEIENEYRVSRSFVWLKSIEKNRNRDEQSRALDSPPAVVAAAHKTTPVLYIIITEIIVNTRTEERRTGLK